MFTRLTGCLMVLCFPFLAFGQMANKMVIDSAEIYFDFGFAQLRPDAVITLDELTQRMPSDTSLHLTVVAHTDSIGSFEANLRLSEKRALAIVNHLNESGIDNTQIDWTFKGENHPQSSNNTEKGRQQNRRAIILVWKLQPPRKPLGYLKGQVLDEEGHPLEAEVRLKLKGLDPKITTSDSITGRWAIPFFKEELGLGILEVYAKDHFFHSQVADLYKAPSLDINVKLQETKAGEKMALNKLYFVGNQAVLLPHSRPELKRLLRFMEINKHIKIEIGGHVNHPFTAPEDLPAVSMQLSFNRAKVVFDYLIENGVAEARMQFKGYGNSQMVFPQTRLESEAKMNRRVEVKILSKEALSSVE
ncbi:MAG: OmpA family protein [Bacteroidota bacterium]